MSVQTLDHLLAFMEANVSGRPLFCDLAGQSVTNRDFARRVRGLATGLRGLCPEPGRGVAVLGLNDIETVEIILAAALAGLLPVPLNLRWTPAEINFALHDADVAIVALGDAFAPLAPALQGPGPLHLVHIGRGDVPAGLTPVADLRQSPLPLNLNRAPHSAAIALYTGGTTGRSKGVIHSHASLLAGATAMALANFPTAGKTYLSCFPFFHIAGIQPALTRMMQGSTQALVPMFRPDLLAKACETFGVQELGLAPTMMQMLISDAGFDAARFASVERLMYGSSPISGGLLAALKAAFPSVGFTQAYGMTEAGIVFFLGPQFHQGDLARLDAAGQAGAPFVRVQIEDPDGQPLPAGQVGEIVIYGPTVMAGYHNLPDATGAALRRGGYRTGDVGQIDELGLVYVRDRLKDMIISGGENVYSAEVEDAISTCPGVAQVAVIGLPDPKWGEAVHAVIVPAPDASPTLEQVVAHLRPRLAGYKHPRSISLTPALPLSPLNKVLKHSLRDSLAADRGAK